MHLIKFKDRDDWVASRKDGLGSSEIAGIMGYNRFSSPLKVWMDKTGRDKKDVDNMFTRAGNYLEEPIARWFADSTKTHVRMARDWAGSEFVICHSTGCTWARATPDAFIDLALSPGSEILPLANKLGIESGSVGLLEIKNTSAWKADDWVTGPPPMVYAQVQWQMFCTGHRWAAVAVLIGGNDMRWFIVQWDEDMIMEMQTAGHRFWHTHVKPDVAPEVQGDVDKEFLQQLYPDEDMSEGSVALDAEAADWDDEIIAAQARIKDDTQKVKDLKAKLIGKIGRNSEGILPDGTKYTYKKFSKKGYVREVKAWTGRVLRRSKKK